MLLKISSLLGISVMIFFGQWYYQSSVNEKNEMPLTTKYFRYMEDDISFNNLKNPNSWVEDEFPASTCTAGDLPCLVSIDNLQDYGGSYSPGVIDEVDFARYLELEGSGGAQTYVTGIHQEASKD